MTEETAPEPPAGYVVHRCGPGGRFTPPVPVEAIQSILRWEGGAWVRPAFIDARPAYYATKATR